MLSLSSSWRLPCRIALVFWLVCTLSAGAFLGGGEVIPLTCVLVSLVFWLSVFVLALRHPSVSLLIQALVSIGPLLLFGATVFLWIFVWSR
jgi:hypothetical protein